MGKYRIGIGEDIHRLCLGRKLILGGVEIPFGEGLDGHSDADCLLHSLMDALLGALALGDIGVYFPPDDPAYEGADSKKLAKEVMGLIKGKGYCVSNCDLLLFAEAPKLKPYAEAIRHSVADILEVGIEDVGFQAMSNEGLDAVGQRKAIRAVSAVLLEKAEGEEK